MVTHELQTPPGRRTRSWPPGTVIEAIRGSQRGARADEHPWVGAETYFLGEVHGGDFYNRFPTTCRLVGTRRWAPGNRLDGVEAEFRALLAPIADGDGLHDRPRPAARARRLRDRSRAPARRSRCAAATADVTGAELAARRG